jgi:hypothetical protein
MIRYGLAYVDEGARSIRGQIKECRLKSGKEATSRDSEDMKNECQIETNGI